ncbi:hypothetical protein LY76DRAFT_340208 [Colletotrichum caudatum]|nr:hypothetical protein LY76DRAFT_340208 [Colletotrichum caudatum]
MGHPCGARAVGFSLSSAFCWGKRKETRSITQDADADVRGMIQTSLFLAIRCLSGGCTCSLAEEEKGDTVNIRLLGAAVTAVCMVDGGRGGANWVARATSVRAAALGDAKLGPSHTPLTPSSHFPFFSFLSLGPNMDIWVHLAARPSQREGTALY